MSETNKRSIGISLAALAATIGLGGFPSHGSSFQMPKIRRGNKYMRGTMAVFGWIVPRKKIAKPDDTRDRQMSRMFAAKRLADVPTHKDGNKLGLHARLKLAGFIEHAK